MPGTESSESTTDKDVQEQLWEDKKVPVERIKGYAHHLVIMDKNNFRIAAHGFVSYSGGFIQGQHM